SSVAIPTGQVHCSGCRLWQVCAANDRSGALLTTHVLCNFEHAKICILIGVDSLAPPFALGLNLVGKTGCSAVNFDATDGTMRLTLFLFA
ncbi:hypothetical protein M5D96_004087, partial [Drosophila gunungcola]